MQWAVGSTKRALQRHGSDLPYSTITRTVDSIEGSVTEVITNVTLRIYPEPLQVNQYNFPTLVVANRADLSTDDYKTALQNEIYFKRRAINR